jgi:DNA-binding XRE family transcriptional regulator
MSKTKLYDKMREVGISDEEMANKLSVFEVRKQTVFQWADGRRVPSAKAKKAIAKILGCKVSDIF